MIRVPSYWPCAVHSCAVVEVDALVFVCRVMATQVATTRYAFEPTVQLEAAIATRLVAQDYTTEEVHEVQWCDARDTSCGTSASSSCADKALYYMPLTAAPDEVGVRSEVATAANVQRSCATQRHGTIRIRCALFTHVAASITLTGPRRDARATPAHLLSALYGHYVAVGAAVQTREGRYMVSALAMKSGYGGVALVGARCKLKLNATPGSIVTSETSANDGAVGGGLCGDLLGLDEAQQTLSTLLCAAHASPGRSFYVLVRGPHGCGVSSLVMQCLTGRTVGACDVVRWRNDFDANAAKHCVCPVLVLLIEPAEHYFASDSPEVAKLTLRKLEHDVQRLLLHASLAANAPRRAVLVLAVTHNYSSGCAGGLMESVFTEHVVVGLPDAELRAALLARVRGGTAETWRGEALTLVGRSAQEVLELGQDPGWCYQPPFRPVRWEDIGGLQDVKARLYSALIWPQRAPQLFRRFNLTPPKGILLYGPPGCAKTTLVRALCSEGYFSFIYLDSASVVSAYVGESERYLRDVFARAAQQAPCIVFFDEVEVLGGRRGDSGHVGVEQVRLLSTLLTEMDGFAKAARDVCFVGATNVPHLLDPALLRPGRFDYLIYVPLPDEADRQEILSLLLPAPRVAADTARLARLTTGFSGADLQALCSAALLELIAHDDAPPPCLQDRDHMTGYLESKIATFDRAVYDSNALLGFRREHAMGV